MVGKLLIFVGVLALTAPMLHAQAVTVCVFQAHKGHKMADDSDAQQVVTALSQMKLPNGDTINAIPINGVSPNDEVAEARKRGCAFVADLWRENVPASTPMAAAASANPSSSSTAGVYPTDSGSSDSTVLDYSLRKIDSDKKIAHGEEDKASPWSQVAGAIAKKIASAK